jgi:hypothetical protein
MSARVLVRDERTRKYLGRDGGWVAEPAEAKRFETLQGAGKEARNGEERSVVVNYEEPPCELAINPVFCV